MRRKNILDQHPDQYRIYSKFRNSNYFYKHKTHTHTHTQKGREERKIDCQETKRGVAL